MTQTGPEGPRKEVPVAAPARDLQAKNRRRDLARVLPVLGAVLLVSPLLDMAAGGGQLLGIPGGVLYVFGVWSALILATALLARRLNKDTNHE